MQKLRTYATLTIVSKAMAVSDLVNEIGIAPDKTREQDTPVEGQAGGVYPHNVVTFESRADPTADPVAHIYDLVSRLEAAANAIRSIAESRHSDEPASVPVRLSLYVESTRSQVGLDIPGELLVAIDGLGARLGIEIETQCESLGS